ncbi:MAG: alanine racemase [Polyangiaceae bacterium]
MSGTTRSDRTSVDANAHHADDETIRVLRPRRAAPADAVRPTRAEINLGAVRHNLHVLRRALQTQGVTASAPSIWGVLKADAYGHGAPAVARTLERAKIDGLCVALLEEAIELRSAGITIPILVMGGYFGPAHRGLEEVLEHDLTPVLYHPDQIERLATLTRDRNLETRPAFHVKVDTGMARLGAAPTNVDALFDVIADHRELEFRGLMSHLACADDPEPGPTNLQLRAFADVRERARRHRLVPQVCHIANSAAALAYPSTRFDAVRPGIALYGVSPFFGRSSVADAALSASGELRPVMRVRTEIVALRDLAAGDAVGYCHTWRASSPRRIATVPMGYADGLTRSLSNKGAMLVRGRRAPIVGVVSMDLTTIDVTDIPGAALGDEVVVLGSQEPPRAPLIADNADRTAAAITAEEIAQHTGTIPWEVVTNISRRVPRFYREP